MTSGIRVLSFSSVRQEVIEEALTTLGVNWSEASHICATQSLADSMLSEGNVAVAIADVLNLSMGQENFAESLSTYPDHLLAVENYDRYREQRRTWRQVESGRRISQTIRFDQAVRTTLPQWGIAGDFYDVLTHSANDLRKSILSLAQAGVSPDMLKMTDLQDGITEIQRLAISLWSELELNPKLRLTEFRNDLWIDLKEYSEQSSTHAELVQTQILQTLSRLFGDALGGRTIVHHGFYFYTPAQWALFMLLSRTPGIDQVFIVHDDGRNPVFTVWREFFSPKFDMPSEIRVATEYVPTVRAQEFRNSITGKKVKGQLLQSSLEVVHCRHASDLVRKVTKDDSERRIQQEKPRFDVTGLLYAAAAQDLRIIGNRLNPGDNNASTNLAQLPIGIFLICLHNCLSVGSNGNTQVRLNAEDLMGMLSSGFLTVNGLAPSDNMLNAFRRALPFFNGIRELPLWISRGEDLYRHINDDIAVAGGRNADETTLERMAKVSRNPLRLAPWADLTSSEAEWIAQAIANVARILEEVAAQGSIRIADYVRKVRSQLEEGLKFLDERERKVLTDKFTGVNFGIDETVDVQAIVDVVGMLLGRSVDFDEDEQIGGDFYDEAIRQLSDLDVLGYRQSILPIHVMNLSDGVFPGRVSPVRWPFTVEMLEQSLDVPTIQVDLLKTRQVTSGLSDLYLFWLALDGVSDNQMVTLSWVEHLAGETKNPSGLLQSLFYLTGQDIAGAKAALEEMGGIEPISPGTGHFGEGLRDMPQLVPNQLTESEMQALTERLPIRALSSSMVCPKRFTLQWATGTSPSFQPSHMHGMLYGNLEHALNKWTGIPIPKCQRIASDLFRFMTDGERESSLTHRGIWSEKSASPEWIFTLSGNKNPIKVSTSSFSGAYQTATGQLSGGPQIAIKQTLSNSVIPQGSDSAKLCNMCPVSPECLERRLDFEEDA